jgi:hypothetical protein
MLVEAANAAGGKDNISIVFVAGPDFAGADSKQSQDARVRHATTRPRTDTARAGGWKKWAKYGLVMLGLLGLGVAAWRLIVGVTSVPPVPALASQPAAVTPAHTVEVSASDARGIIDALSTAEPGETIVVPPGEFLGPLLLKEGVDIVAKVPRQTIVKSDPAATAEQGLGIVSRGVQKALIDGIRVAADDTHPLKTGVLVMDSSVKLRNLEVSGAVYSGIRIEGISKPYIEECFIHGNGGAGVGVGRGTAPTLIRNQVMQNGLMVNAVRPGIEIGPGAKPVMDGNLISGNGADEPLKTGHTESKKRGDQ